MIAFLKRGNEKIIIIHTDDNMDVPAACVWQGLAPSERVKNGNQDRH
jgi:hypothetical protein